MTRLVIAFVFCGAASADEKPDREKLVGTWKVVEFQDDGADRMGRLTGRALTLEDKPESYPRLVFTADACYLLRPGKAGGVRETVGGLTNVHWRAATLDEKASPKAIDLLTHKNNPADKDVTLPGVYEIDGAKLRICWNETPGQSKNRRPDKLLSDGTMNLLVCERLSDEPEKPASDQPMPKPKEAK